MKISSILIYSHTITSIKSSNEKHKRFLVFSLSSMHETTIDFPTNYDVSILSEIKRKKYVKFKELFYFTKDFTYHIYLNTMLLH